MCRANKGYFILLSYLKHFHLSALLQSNGKENLYRLIWNVYYYMINNMITDYKQVHASVFFESGVAELLP